jgi:predicted histone-like DNA-binding protein
MSVKITAVGKTNPRNTAEPLTYYPTAIKRGEIDLDALSEKIAYSTTATSADCYLIILALVKTISQELEQGNAVRLGHMGSFKISVKGIGAATANEVNATHVRSAHINFQPGKHFKNMLTTLKYEVKR